MITSGIMSLVALHMFILSKESLSNLVCLLNSVYCLVSCLLSPLIHHSIMITSLPLYLHQSHELINGLLFSWELLLQADCHLSLPCVDVVLSEDDREVRQGRSEMVGNVILLIRSKPGRSHSPL